MHGNCSCVILALQRDCSADEFIAAKSWAAVAPRTMTHTGTYLSICEIGGTMKHAWHSVLYGGYCCPYAALMIGPWAE